MKEYVPLRKLRNSERLRRAISSKSFVKYEAKNKLVDLDDNTSKQLGGSIEPQVFSIDQNRFSDSECEQFNHNQSIVEFKSDTRSFLSVTMNNS